MGFSVIFARSLQQAMMLHGRDPASWLERCRIDRDRLHDARQTLSLEEVELLVQSAIEETSDPGLGLTVGANTTPMMLQLLGLLMVAQRTPREAFDVLRRYSSLLASDLRFELHEASELASFSCLPGLEQSSDLKRFTVELTLAFAKRLGQQFTIRGASLTKVQLSYASSSCWARYWDVFQCPAEFEQPRDALVFPRSYLDLVQPHADKRMDSTLRRAADKVLRERDTSHELVQRLNMLLRSERALAHVSHEALARGAGMSLRALRRKLSTEGVALSGVIQDVRVRSACDELLRPGSTIVSTAKRVGFSEASAFHRAFKRWMGCTPRQFLMRHQPSSKAVLESLRQAPAGP